MQARILNASTLSLNSGGRIQTFPSMPSGWLVHESTGRCAPPKGGNKIRKRKQGLHHSRDKEGHPHGDRENRAQTPVGLAAIFCSKRTEASRVMLKGREETNRLPEVYECINKFNSHKQVFGNMDASNISSSWKN